jgi:processive 1,2-diacylglycerol beta-glucosyltransferase
MKVFVVHASYGEGHKRAAQALEGVLDAKCIDLLDFCHPWIKKHTSRAYLDMTRGKGVFWSLLFHSSKFKFSRRSLDIFCGAVFYAFLRYLRFEKPDVVIATHPFVTPILLELKKELDFKVIVVVTDIKVHPWWVYDGVDHYFAALDETKSDLVALGVPLAKISCGFVPVRPGFWQEHTQAALRKKIGVDSKPCIMFISSVRGKFPYLKGLLAALSENYNLLVVCGRNEKYKKQIDELNLPSVKSFGFYEAMWELVACASIIVTKPGGLTVFEGMAQKKLFIFTHFIPGQEKDNMNILISKHIGAYPRMREDFLATVDKFAAIGKRDDFVYPVVVNDMRPEMERIIKAF